MLTRWWGPYLAFCGVVTLTAYVTILIAHEPVHTIGICGLAFGSQLLAFVAKAKHVG